MTKFACTNDTFRPAPHDGVRWLDVERDFCLARDLWAKHGQTISLDDWNGFHAAGYRYCAIIKDQAIAAKAAVWRYSEDAWEVAAVSTEPEYRRQGLGKAVVAFVTACIIQSGRVATCTTEPENVAMRRTAESVGFCECGSAAVDSE